MNKLVAIACVACGPLLTPLFASGCGDACDDLVDICARCTDASYRTSCEQTVAGDVQDVCSSNKSTYETACPQRPDAGASSSSSSSSTSSSGGGAGGASSSGGGAGGASSSGGGAGGASSSGGGAGGG